MKLQTIVIVVPKVLLKRLCTILALFLLIYGLIREEGKVPTRN
jgi:hypothetical protein